MQAHGGPSDQPVVPSLALSFTEGPVTGTELVVAQEEFHIDIGRTCKSNLIIKDTTVCEVHAKLSWGGVAWVLRDMYSVNGTYLNGRLLRPFVDIAVLKDGDEVTFGESKCVVRLTARTIADLNVGQLMRACVEAAAHRIEMRGLDNAKALLTEMCEAKAVLLSKVTSDEHETPLTSKQELEVSLAELCAAQHVLRFDPV